MTAQVVTALIAAGTSLVIAAVSIFISRRSEKRLADLRNESERQLAQLRSELDERRAESDALREYEYEARKRLYTECEPILFQAGELAQDARGRIASLARSAREGAITPDGKGWLSSRGYYFESTLFRLLAPHTAFKLLQRRLTVIDLALEPRIWAQYELLKVLYDSFTQDFELAKRDPRRPYAPDRADPGLARAEERRERWPALFARQGFYRGTFEQVVEALVREPGEETGGGGYGSRAKTFGEFSRDLADETSETNRLAPHLTEVFGGFHPTRKPVLWRVLLAQDLLYDVLLRISRDSGGGEVAPLAQGLMGKEMPGGLTWLPDGEMGAMAREFRAASDQVAHELAKIDVRLGLSRAEG